MSFRHWIGSDAKCWRYSILTRKFDASPVGGILNTVVPAAQVVTFDTPHRKRGPSMGAAIFQSE
jgi:hypothetical protein